MSKVIDKDYLGDVWTTNRIALEFSIQSSVIKGLDISAFFNNRAIKMVHVKKSPSHKKTYLIYLPVHIAEDGAAEIISLIKAETNLINPSSIIKITHQLEAYTRELQFGCMTHWIDLKMDAENKNMVHMGFDCANCVITPRY